MTTISPLPTLGGPPTTRPIALSPPTAVATDTPSANTQQPTFDLPPSQVESPKLEVLGSSAASDTPEYPKLNKDVEPLPKPQVKPKEKFPPLKLTEEAMGTNLLANIQPSYFNQLVGKFAYEVRPMSAALQKATQYLAAHPVQNPEDARV